MNIFSSLISVCIQKIKECMCTPYFLLFVVTGTFGEPALVNTSLLVDNLEYAPERRECRYTKNCRRNKILNP